jgi:hypothetical protein
LAQGFAGGDRSGEGTIALGELDTVSLPRDCLIVVNRTDIRLARQKYLA